jgi:hypothetical protein
VSLALYTFEIEHSLKYVSHWRVLFPSTVGSHKLLMENFVTLLAKIWDIFPHVLKFPVFVRCSYSNVYVRLVSLNTRKPAHYVQGT